MISKCCNYIPAVKNNIFFQILRRLTNLPDASIGPCQNGIRCKALFLNGFQNKIPKMVIF